MNLINMIQNIQAEYENKKSLAQDRINTFERFMALVLTWCEDLGLLNYFKVEKNKADHQLGLDYFHYDLSGLGSKIWFRLILDPSKYQIMIDESVIEFSEGRFYHFKSRNEKLEVTKEIFAEIISNSISSFQFHY